MTDGVTVAIVDDHELNLRVFRHVLERTGIPLDIVEGGDGHDAVRLRFTDAVPAFMITNGLMPGLDGLAACKEIRRREVDGDHPRVPLIFSSASASMTLAAIRGPADLWLDRPINPDQLVALVRFLLGRPSPHHP